jgi:hypothetical protein
MVRDPYRYHQIAIALLENALLNSCQKFFKVLVCHRWLQGSSSPTDIVCHLKISSYQMATLSLTGRHILSPSLTLKAE